MRTYISALHRDTHKRFVVKKGERKKNHDDERTATANDNNIKASATDLKRRSRNTLKQNESNVNRQQFIW